VLFALGVRCTQVHCTVLRLVYCASCSTAVANASLTTCCFPWGKAVAVREAVAHVVRGVSKSRCTSCGHAHVASAYVRRRLSRFSTH
jgi:hypothetical protein